MKLRVIENKNLAETEVVINCQSTKDELVRRICAMLEMFDKRVTGICEGQTFILAAFDILYLESVERKTFLYTIDRVYESPLRLYELEEKLASEDFVRATKSCVLNFSRVKSLRSDFGGRLLCTLENGECLTVSRQYAKIIKQKLKYTKE